MGWLMTTPRLSNTGEELRLTLALKPFSLVTVMVVEAEEPALT